MYDNDNQCIVTIDCSNADTVDASPIPYVPSVEAMASVGHGKQYIAVSEPPKKGTVCILISMTLY